MKIGDKVILSPEGIKTQGFEFSDWVGEVRWIYPQTVTIKWMSDLHSVLPKEQVVKYPGCVGSNCECMINVPKF